MRSPALKQVPYKRLPLQILNDEIHVWRLSLSTTEEATKLFQLILSPDELARADRFVFARDRMRFVKARAGLRSILARYISLEPHLVRFSYGSRGKPMLADSQNGHRLFFSLSHSCEKALVAVGRGSPVGIDIERIRTDVDVVELTSQVFSPVEQATFARIGEHKRIEAFFKGWTSKEAYIKGLGHGLDLSLKEFDVCVDPEKPAQLLRAFSRCGSESWFLHSVDHGENYAATLATTQRYVRVASYDLLEF
jgi:4'-phosphopantetheinyl transferase